MKQLRPRKTKKVKVKFEYVSVDMTYKPMIKKVQCGDSFILGYYIAI